MKKLTKKTFEGLYNSFQALSIEEQIEIIGGNDCVLYCFQEMSNYSVDWYVDMVAEHCGYNTYVNGLLTADIEAVGAMGGLTVSEIHGDFNYINNGSNGGALSSGASLMMTFAGTSYQDHAVFVTKIEQDPNGNFIAHYRDPQDCSEGSLNLNNASGLYSIR